MICGRLVDFHSRQKCGRRTLLLGLLLFESFVGKWVSARACKWKQVKIQTTFLFLAHWLNKPVRHSDAFSRNDPRGVFVPSA